jgi:hypothetical protein
MMYGRKDTINEKNIFPVKIEVDILWQQTDKRNNSSYM